MKERDHLEGPGLNRIIFRWLFRHWDMRVWTGSSWLKTDRGGGHLLMR
jgi:hypothetical protein